VGWTSEDASEPSNRLAQEQITNSQGPSKIVSLRSQRPCNFTQSNSIDGIQGGQERQSPSPATPHGKVNNEATIKGMGLDATLGSILPQTVAEPLVNRRFDQQ
jgi:hypothetical protein